MHTSTDPQYGADGHVCTGQYCPTCRERAAKRTEAERASQGAPGEGLTPEWVLVDPAKTTYRAGERGRVVEWTKSGVLLLLDGDVRPTYFSQAEIGDRAALASQGEQET